MAIKQCLIYCRCGGENVSDELHRQLASLIGKFNLDVFELHDLCAYSINEKEVLNSISEKYPKKIVMACYPRAVKSLLAQGNIDLGDYDFISFKELNSVQIESKLKNDFGLEKGEAQYRVLENSLDVPAWFPVIEESRCTICGKCARFCLFGVYKYDKKNLNVVNPLACKNLCPACGRACPSMAIMFPRLAEKTTLAGAEPGTFTLNTEQTNLLGQLQNRNRNRKSILREGLMQQAEEERRKALEEFKNISTRKK